MSSHPYISGPGNVAQMIAYLRKNFPATVNADTVKKFSLASNNESYVINALQFVGVIDEAGKRTEEGHRIFVLADEPFQEAFAGLVRAAYSDLFDMRGDDAWTLSRKDLTAYFRTTDKTSEVIGGRQAGLFQTLRSVAGYQTTEEKAAPKPQAKVKAPKQQRSPKAKTVAEQTPAPDVKSPGGTGKVEIASGKKDMALTVRVEVNLPANASQETYDAIFKSIRANLIDE